MCWAPWRRVCDRGYRARSRRIDRLVFSTLTVAVTSAGCPPRLASLALLLAGLPVHRHGQLVSTYCLNNVLLEVLQRDRLHAPRLALVIPQPQHHRVLRPLLLDELRRFLFREGPALNLLWPARSAVRSLALQPPLVQSGARAGGLTAEELRAASLSRGVVC